MFVRHIWVISLPLVFAFFFLAVPRGLVADRQDLSQHVDTFIEMARRVELCGDTNTPCELSAPTVWRENIPVLIVSSNEVGRIHAKNVISSISEALQDVIDVQLVPDGKAKMVIYVGGAKTDREIRNGDTLVNQYLFERILGVDPNACFGNVFWEDTTIFGAIIYVNGRLQGDDFRLCLEEEVINSLGLFSDPEGFGSLYDYPKFLSSSSEPSYSDLLLTYLRVLYSIGSFDRKEIRNRFIDNLSL